jgi:parvulin-like peptidyl-prolyl isomerase
MPSITINENDILHHIRCACKIPDLVEEIAKIKIIVGKAEDLKIEIDPSDLQKASDIFRVMNGMKTARDTWLWLDKYSLSLDDFEETVAVNLTSGQLANYLFEDKVEKHFIDNIFNYYGVVMYEIVFDDRDLAMKYFFSIKEEKISFFEVAYKHIKDVDLRRKCGFRGLLNVKQLQPEVSASVFSIDFPGLLKPIQTNLGFHLILVEEIIKPKLDNKLKVFIISELFLNWLEREVRNIDLLQSIA